MHNVKALIILPKMKGIDNYNVYQITIVIENIGMVIINFFGFACVSLNAR